MVGLNLFFMAKSKRKIDYINDLCTITRLQAEKLTVKQLRQLVAKYELG